MNLRAMNVEMRRTPRMRQAIRKKKSESLKRGLPFLIAALILTLSLLPLGTVDATTLSTPPPARHVLHAATEEHVDGQHEVVLTFPAPAAPQKAVTDLAPPPAQPRVRIATKTQTSLTITSTHDPISINGNADFAAQAASNGWSGDGSSSNPYIIEDLVIITDLAYTHAIAIRNTTVHFIIRNCTVSARGAGVYSSPENRTSGIYLYNVTNGVLMNNVAYNNTYDGFALWNSSNNTLSNNTAYNNNELGFALVFSSNNTLSNNTAYNNNRYGFGLSGSSNNTLSNNTAYNNTYPGFYLVFSSNNMLSNNIASHNVHGFFLFGSSNNTLNNNIASHNAWRGFGLEGSSNNTLNNNTAHNNGGGFGLEGSSNNTLNNNTAYNNTSHGFYLVVSSNDNTVSNNTAHDNNWDGFYLLDSSNNTLSNNTAYNNNERGFYLYNSSYNAFNYNIAYNNTQYGFYLYNSSYNAFNYNIAYNNTQHGFYLSAGSGNNVITRNDFWFNNGGGIQAHGDNATNAFDYNYWSDHATPDADHDGIVDTPYFLDGSGNVTDPHPVTAPYHPPIVVEGTRNLTYELGETGHVLSWSVNTIVPDSGTYTIYRNGTVVDLGSWTSDTAITVNVDGLAVGTYNYTVVVTDQHGNHATDTVFVTVQDTTAPTLTHPADVTYELGTTGHALSWTVTDNAASGTYTIYRNGTMVNSGAWINGTSIIVNVDGLAVGTYNFTLVVFDQSGNVASDTAFVTVIPSSSTSTTTTETRTTTSPPAGEGLIPGFLVVSVVLGLVGLASHRARKKKSP